MATLINSLKKRAALPPQFAQLGYNLGLLDEAKSAPIFFKHPDPASLIPSPPLPNVSPLSAAPPTMVPFANQMVSDVFLAVAHATISQKKSQHKPKSQIAQSGPNAIRLLELEIAADEVKQNALISALSIIILKEINVCNGQLNAAASSFEAMQSSVPVSLHKKVKGFVTLVRADIQHLNRSEPEQFLKLTLDQSAVLLSLSKPPLSNAVEFAAKEQAVSVMFSRMAQAQELLGSQMEIFLKATSTDPKLTTSESSPSQVLILPALD